MMAPGSLMPFLKTPLFSWHGKLRMALDLFIPRRERDTDEAGSAFCQTSSRHRSLHTDRTAYDRWYLYLGCRKFKPKGDLSKILGDGKKHTEALSKHSVLKKSRQPKPAETPVVPVIVSFCRSNQACRH